MSRRPGHDRRRVNVDFQNWIIESLDVRARRWCDETVRHQDVDCRAAEGRNKEGELTSCGARPLTRLRASRQRLWTLIMLRVVEPVVDWLYS